MNQNHKRSTSDTLVFAASPGVRWNLAQRDRAVTQLQEYLSSHLDMTVSVVLDENYEDILKGLENGTIDVAKLGPYAYAQAQARFGARALVKAVDVTVGTARSNPYRSIIFTRTDSGIMHLTQLKQQKFGFVDSHSTTGYLMATFMLEQAGLNPTSDIEPIFLLSHQAVAEAVLKGQIVAGAIMEEEFMYATQTEEHAILRLLSMSPLLTRGPIVTRPDLPRQIERKLLFVLEKMHLTPHDYFQLIKAPTQQFVPVGQHEKSLKSVAELAGVSYATVSRAINNSGRIAPATTARILKLVEELGYRPNANARSLHKSKGELIGLLLPSLNYPNLDEIVKGIQETLDEAQMQLFICPVSQSEPKEALQRQKTYFELFSNSRFEGIILTQWNTLDPTASEMLVRNGRPYIVLEQFFLHQGLTTAWEWLAQHGHTHVGLVSGPRSLLEPITTRQMCEQLPGAHFQFIPSATDLPDWQAILAQTTNRPTAFLCTDDQTVIDVRHTLNTLHVQHPTLDLKHAPIMGIGQNPLASLSSFPRLTFDGVELGRQAARRLLKMLNIFVATQDTDVPCWIQE
jgi:phosphate/phosphite/phosphonate ABC transporter binding protein